MEPDDIKYPELRIQPELMDKLRDIVKRRDEVQALVEKADNNKTKVKPAIYSKVISDYKSRLKAINIEFAPISEQVKKELDEVQKREKDIRVRLQEVSDDLEEQRFRCQIGEFPKNELEPIETEMGEVQRELNEQIGVLEQTYEECSRCLSEPPPEPPPPAAAESEAAQVPETAELARIPTPPPLPADGAPVELRSLKSDPTRASPPATPPEPAPAPAPEPERRGHALKLLKKGGDPELYPLSADKLSIGRSPKSDVVLKEPGVSRTHAHVVRTSEDQFTIIDTSGGEGVSINGKKQKKAALQSGDRITIASVEFEVVPT